MASVADLKPPRLVAGRERGTIRSLTQYHRESVVRKLDGGGSGGSGGEGINYPPESDPEQGDAPDFPDGATGTTGAIGGTGAAGADGAAVPTSTIGRRTFTVQAEDVAQNARTVRVRYTVVPVCAGELATVYVAGGKIVGGPDTGDAYTGTLRGGGTGDVIVGTAGADDLAGAGGGGDTASVGSGADELRGDAGDDVMRGDAGNDTLNGGTGSNRLLSGTGFDTCTPKSSTRRSCEG